MPPHPARSRAASALDFALAVAPAAARAGLATTNLQALAGWSFHDPTANSDATGGQMATLTVDHFTAWKVPFLFTGFVDVDGVKAGKGWEGFEVMARPELLVDLLALAGGPGNALLAGVEWYVLTHPSNHEVGAPSDTVSAPQVVLQWNPTPPTPGDPP